MEAKRWVRGLTTIPRELFYDDWTTSTAIPAVLSDYYPTIEVDLSA